MENILDIELARHLASVFSERKITQNCALFSTKLTFLQFHGSFLVSLHSIEQFLDQNECMVSFLIHSLFELYG
jgi:hypothetical protein